MIVSQIPQKCIHLAILYAVLNGITEWYVDFFGILMFMSIQGFEKDPIENPYRYLEKKRWQQND